MKHAYHQTNKRDDFGQEYLSWYNRVNSPGEHFDPSSLVKLARKQWSNHPELAEAFSRVTRQWNESELYTHFMNPKTMFQPGDRHWNFACTLALRCPERGALLVDIMKDGSIGGMEYLDRAMGRPVDLDRFFVGLVALTAKNKGMN